MPDLPQLFADQAAATPGAIAVVSADGEVSYAELVTWADRIAGYLRAQGEDGGMPVGVAIGRSTGLVAALLGVLRAGMPYLPLDPDLPAARLADIVTDAGVRAVLVDKDRPGWLPAGVAAVPLGEASRSEPAPAAAPRPDDLAYVIFTSGSTGRSKAVMIPHRALTNLLASMQERPGLSDRDVLVAVTTVSFDIAALELFLPLITGARVVMANPAQVTDPRLLAALISSSDATVLQATPATYQMLRNVGWRPPAGFTVLCGGERLPVDLADWLTGMQGVTGWDLYGPTETTIWSSSRRLGGDYAPVDATTLHILDDSLAAVGTGELYIGGAGLARGYAGNPGLTAERFLPNPLDGAGERLYRTGDVARRRDDGSIEILGRTDHQIKVRGHRVELGEIEAVLARHPAVRQAIVHPVPGRTGFSTLVAYVVADGRPELREHAAAQLPDYMVPGAFRFLDALPLTDNGKVDRNALPAEGLDTPADSTAPRTEGERMVTGIWAEVFGLESVGVHEDFFALGGHSLIAVQIMARLREQLGVDVPLATLLEQPTPAGHATAASRSGPAQAPLVPVPRDGDLPVSSAQLGLWLNECSESGTSTTSFGTHAAYQLRGRLDVPALRAALDASVARHEALCTVFPEVDGIPVQRIGNGPGHAFSVRGPTTQDEATELLRTEVGRPFDLNGGPLMRVLLVKLPSQEHLLLFHWHHIIFDGWSLELFLQELTADYAGEPTPRPAIQYADYAVWERSRAADASYWRTQLADAPPEVVPVPDRPRSAMPSGRGAQLYVEMPKAVRQGLGALAARVRCTPFSAMLTAFSLLVSRFSGSDDVVIGVPWAGRDRPEVAGLIGLFADTLVLRVDASGEPSVEELTARVQQTVLEAHAHREISFERLVQELTPERRSGRHPLFQVLFNLEEIEPPRLPGLAVSEADVESGTARFDLAVTVRMGRIQFEYATDLYDPGTIRRMAGHYVDLLTALAAASTSDDTTTLALPTRGEQRVQELVELRACLQPDALAVDADDGTLTYRELNAAANRLAHRLRSCGVQPDEPVAVLISPGRRLIVALLAVLKSGGAYLPLDPAHPAIRRDTTVAAAGARVTLTDADVDKADNAKVAEHNPAPASGTDGLAYVIPTSGSTGTPKLVALPHRALVNLIRWQSAYQPSALRTAQLASSTFDVSFTEIFVTLASGGQVVVPAADVRGDPEKLARWLDSRRVEAVFTTPTMLDLIAREWPRLPPRLTVVTVSGEQLTATGPIRQVLETIAVYNHYGPSETHCATAHRCSGDFDAGSLAIGTAIGGQRIHLLDERMRPVPAGAPGEIYIGGAGLARGYLHAPGRTAERFLPDPYATEPGSRMYRSGDRGRLRADGAIVYLGRTDQQLKLRGVRIEPGEIEAELAYHSDVRAAAVAVHDQRLVAYVVPAGNVPPEPGKLRNWLRGRLPEAMIPSYYLMVDALPLTTSGKLHRAGLPVPDGLYTAGEYVAPRSASEKVVADVWAEVLEHKQIGAEDDFFTIGGHSLLAARIAARLRTATGTAVSVRDVLTRPTIAALADLIGEGSRASAALLPERRPEVLPLSHTQRQLWFLDQLQPGGCAYQLPHVLRLRGPLNLSALRDALTGIVARHEVLRTRYPVQGDEPVQSIAPPSPVKLRIVEAKKAKLDGLIAQECWRPFDLAAGPVFRTLLIRLAPQEHVLVCTTHHIASDGWSMAVFDHELDRLYAGELLPPPPVQYADFAVWEQRMSAPTPRLAYWRDELAGLPTLDTGTDRERPPVWDQSGALTSFTVPGDVGRQVRRVAHDARATPFMVLFAAYAVVLATRSGQPDFAIGVPSAGRSLPEVENVIGCFVNTLPLRVRVPSGMTFSDLLAYVRRRALAGYAAEVPFERIVEELRPLRDRSRQPLTDVLFVLTEQSAPRLVGLETIALPVPSQGASFDLSLEIEQQADDSLRGELEYATALFDHATAERICAAYHHVLAAVCADPDRPLDTLPSGNR